MFRRREFAALDRRDICAHRSFGIARGSIIGVREVLHEARHFARINAQHVVQHQHLTVALRARADANGWNAQGVGDARSERRGNHLEHQHRGACGFDRTRICQQMRGIAIAPRLHAIAAELMNALRCQAQMPAYRNAACCDEGHCFHQPCVVAARAFDLDHLRASLHQHRRALIRRRWRRVIRGERQVADQPGLAVRIRQPTRDARNVVAHLFERDR